MKEIMTVFVHINETREVKGKHKTVNQIVFDGTIHGPAFTGVILPGAIDTQIGNVMDGTGMLSARYMAEGVDSEGEFCRLYIENWASFGEELTHPTIITDSHNLQWLSEVELLGRLKVEGEHVKIIIYSQKKPSVV